MEKSQNKLLKLAVLVLAAGAGSRMGKIKQLLPFRNKSLLTHALDEALAVTDAVFCVLGANSEIIQSRLEKDYKPFDKIHVLTNTEWRTGMGSSIKEGVQTILKTVALDGIMITLADQPLVDRHFLKKLFESFRNKPDQVVASGYAGRNGVPAIFPKIYFEHLQNLSGDAGARALLNDSKVPKKVISAKAKLVDIDTYDDYIQLLQMSANSHLGS
ncbi:MAG: nucleotidyltransferase family protein [Leeuwenhoekiella sp.]